MAALLALLLVPAAGATLTRIDPDGTTLLDGQKVFPIVLAKGPEPGSTTPSGADALDEVVSAGVTFLKVGPATTVWNQADVDDAVAQDRAAAARDVHTWVNLSTLSRAQPGSSQDTLLHQVVGTLKGDASAGAIGMWKGADEPWWSGIPVSSLQFAYCLATSRGTSSWCAGEAPVDSDHLWVTVEAPKGTAADVAPYSAVTDVHGVDHYPVTLANADPDLHGVGRWTATLASATPNHAVWTTLQICASGSSDGSGHFVLPTRLQERYMIYDAILNGARNLAFYGGNIAGCWNASDAARGWNWTFWDSVLKPLVQEINAGSPIAPALVKPGSTRALESTDATTQVAVRDGVDASDLWVIAARSGTGSQAVTIRGLPPTATSAAVYTEGRSVPVSGGALTDTFGRWDVHVYHVTLASPPPAPVVSSFAPASGAVGTSLTITGSDLAGATSVDIGGTASSFHVDSATQVTATVPADAASGPVGVTTPGGHATSAASFTVTAPPPSGGGGGGGSGGGSTPPPQPPPAQPPAAPPSPVPTPALAFRLAVAGVATTPAVAVAGRNFTIRLRVVTSTGARVGRGRLTCTAAVGRIRLWAGTSGWTRAGAACTWRLPRSARGKLLRISMRVTRDGSTVARSLVRRIHAPR